MENYEQKYKEAIERCKSWIRGEHPECFTEAQKAGEFIFPELRESEDERIRKEIISYIKSSGAVTNPNWIAWLEKQGERKTPQWMIDFLDSYRRKIGCSLDYDEARDVDGRILCIKEWLERQGEQKPTDKVDTYCQENCKGYRDTGGKCFADGECEAKKKAKQKSFWSEEDEKMYQSIIDDTVQKYLLDGNQFAWLKSIKDRVQPQPKQEWSEKDERMLDNIIFELEENQEHISGVTYKIDWLKSIKPQNGLK